MNEQDILQRINYDINKRFDERDKSFDRLEKLIWGLYIVTAITMILVY
tara:strand:+ start:494 stop:637 length:144 start_codon:yes stop_codon:yes gene_type:complete